jgi:hypothetical protein
MTNNLQESRRLWADMGNRLSYEHQLESAFQLAFSNQPNFYVFIDFLRGEIPIEDIRLDKDLLQPSVLYERIGKNISEQNIDQWTISSISAVTFQLAFDVMRRCLTGEKLAASLIRTQLTYAFFRNCLKNIETKKIEWLLNILSGSQENPIVAAEIIYDLIRAIRDTGKDRNVLTAFFEGFGLEVGAPTAIGLKFTAKWNSAPMLQALIKANNEELAHLHENFIRRYLAVKLMSDDSSYGQWQRQYDQHFQMLINLQSGMFNIGVSYDYGKS